MIFLYVEKIELKATTNHDSLVSFQNTWDESYGRIHGNWRMHNDRNTEAEKI